MATKKKKSKKNRYVYRSAVTGLIVTKRFADLNPETTFRDLVKKK